jgi:hypothetical protein
MSQEFPQFHPLKFFLFVPFGEVDRPAAIWAARERRPAKARNFSAQRISLTGQQINFSGQFAPFTGEQMKISGQ